MTKETAKEPAAAQDPLSEYKRKRDPSATNEPFEAERFASLQGTGHGAFVVHQHHASRPHYDLRIQIGGTLRSFAVPKGPTLDPGEKRLAVQTEDHPLEYLDFEDIIPEGNYGAGPMIAWDVGRIHYLETTGEDGETAGKIDFLLRGHKLNGRFALVETGKRGSWRGQNQNQRQWLLLKKKDAHADTERDVLSELPRSVLSGLTIEQLSARDEFAQMLHQRAAALGGRRGDLKTEKLTPMLCASTGAELHDPGRIYELKLDGVRIVADKRGDDVTLRYRKHRVATMSYPDVARAVRALPVDRVVLDGEIVAFDEIGHPNFQRLARRIHVRRPHDVRRAAAEVPVVYLVFDILQLGEWDLRAAPLVERKALLSDLLQGRGRLRVLDHLEGDGRPLMQLCEAEQLEGLVAKRQDSRYADGGRRSDAWVKVKCERDDDFVVVGWDKKPKKRQLGALLLASYDGDRLVLRGKVGSGIDDQTQDSLLAKLKAIEIDEQPAEGSFPLEQRERRFVRPELVVTVRYAGWSDDGHLRFPVFKGLRPDAEPEDCQAMQGAEQLERAPAPLVEAAPVSTARSGQRAVLTNQDKVFWPDAGYTKGDLCEYYRAVAPRLVPFLRGRPTMLVRHPDGIDGKNFYQWRVPNGTPAWLRRLQLRDFERDGKEVATFVVDDVDGLLHIANLGCIPIHIFACKEHALDECDFFTVDFDLKGAPFRNAVTLALALREMLVEIGLRGYPKTSGQSGLHVLVPLGAGVTFTTAKMLTELLGRILQGRFPDIATMERRVSDRGGRVYVDTGQTGRSRTIVAPYSVRAVPHATVSTPLHWDEVHLALDPGKHTMFSVPDRVQALDDPLDGFDAASPDVGAAVSRLATMIPTQ